MGPLEPYAARLHRLKHVPHIRHYVYEDLYRTPKGAWFLIGEGGALSKYAQNCGNNSTCGGTDWLAFTDEEAFEWLQARHETEALEQYFADRIQDA